MAICDLTTGFALNQCKDGSAGIKAAYIAKWDSKTGYTTDVDGVVTGITYSVVPEFFKYDLTKNTSMLDETQEVSVENGSVGYTPVVTLIFNRLDTASRNELLLLGRTSVVIVIEDRKGQFWLVGPQSGLELNSNRSTGMNLTDRSGSTLTFTGSESEPFVEIEYSAFSAFISSVQI